MKQASVVFAALLVVAVAATAAAPRVGQRAVENVEMLSALSYWTPARMAAAVPRDLLNGSNPALQPTAVPALEPRRSVAGADSGSQGPALSLGAEILEEQLQIEPLQNTTYPHPFTRYFVPCIWKNLYPYKTVGKLFFRIGGTNYVCSASVIRPHLLLTARHCIFDYPSKTWVTNVVFYPGYCAGASNSTQGGPWSARVLHTWVANAGTLDYDIGFIQTFRKNGGQCKPDSTHRQIESYTGYLGYSYGGNYDEKHWDVFGYPAASPFNGADPVQCEAGTGKINPLGYTNTVEIGCDQTGGASGGPWLTAFVPTKTGANYANSLTSFKFTSQPLAVDGPQFQQYNFVDLLNEAIALPCP